MRPLQAKDVLDRRVIAVEADLRPADLVKSKPTEAGIDGRTTHLAVFDAGRFCGLVGVKELSESPPGWILGDLAAKGSVLRIDAATPVEEVCAALERAAQDAAAVVDEAAGGAYLGAVTLDDLRRRLADEQKTLVEMSSRMAKFSNKRIADPIFWIAPDAVILDVNDAACRVFGYTREEMVGGTLADLNPNFAPEAWPAYWAEVKSRGEFTFEARATTKDGRVLDVEVTAYHIQHEMDGGEGGLESNCMIMRDITERKRSALRLAQQEERLRFALESTQDGLWDWSITTGEVYLSPRWCLMLGYKPGEVPSRFEFFLNIVHPDDVGRIEGVLDQHLLGRTAIAECELRLKTRAGAYLWVYNRGKVVARDAAGNPTRMVGAITDISQRKRAEAAAERSAAEMLASNQRLREIIDCCYGFIGLYDLDGTLIEANRAPLEAGGLSREEVIGRPFWETYWWSFSPDVQATLRDALRRAAAGETVRYETPVRIKGDGRITIDVTFGPIRGPDGRVTGIVGFGVDVTEHKKAEQIIRESRTRLQEAQRLAQMGSWELDIRTGRLIWSDTIFEIFEIDQQKFSGTYEDFLDLVHPDDREMVNTAYTRSVQNRTPYNIVHRLRMPDGRVKHVNERCETFYDEQGRPVRSVGTVQDITERTRLEAERAKAAQREALATLAGGIAHEFNSTLLAAGIYLSGIPAGPSGPDPSIAKAVALIQQAQSLSASLLELFACPESAEPPILAVGTWLPGCIDRIADMLPPCVSVSLGPMSGLRPVYADPLAMEQVLRILMGNASDALGGQGTIRVAATVAERDGQAGVEIRVIDEGHGISEADRDRVFEPFFTTRSRSRRSGLGLALATRLVDQVGGLLFYEPNTPTGSIFAVRLRIATLSTES